MNDLDLLRRWGAQLDEPATAPPPAMRTRVLTNRPARTRRPLALTRTGAWRLALSAGLAVAISGGVYWGQTSPGGGPDRGADPAALSGAQVLRNAALVAARQQGTTPRADQFVFTEARGPAWSNSPPTEVGKPAVTTPGAPRLGQAWNSVSGTRDGLVRTRPETDPNWQTLAAPACRDGKKPLVGADGRVVPGKFESMRCRTIPAYQPDLPTEADAMLAWLYDSAKATGKDRTVAAFNAACDLIEGYYLLPAMEAALFESLSQLPGITVQADVADFAGRRGVAIRATPSSSGQPKESELIFDPTTYAFLGTDSTAILRRTIVDNAGQLPS
ncbi:CU044_5270 family protein [Phytohabitans rumicis]|uniref:CU044_5270 family protein n=1 Tax=Phytohabitans rumicis TaxID=1076125 RepID=A0A6V8LHN1_9ACTN|nr:CU044_5270 family protein [Phytohabitans rumicis]GFJ93626.1 hypothetical protein Prum_072680 [Phytohabitans rumicis]